MTFENYLRDHAAVGHALSVRVSSEGVVFTIHPQGARGPAVQFIAVRNSVSPCGVVPAIGGDDARQAA